MPKELKIATHDQVVQSRNFLNLSHHERDYITALHPPNKYSQNSSEETNWLHLHITYHTTNW